MIVLLHGFGGGLDDWYDIQPDLARDGLVIAYDLPGHGRSLRHAAAGTAPAMAKAILADLTARGIERAHVAGFSMGGAVACLMAMRAPERIASLTLLAPGGFGVDINEALLRRLADADGADELREALDDMSGPGYAHETRHVAAIAALRRIEGQRESLETIVGMIARDGRQGEIPRDALARLAMPVTVVWGTADPVLSYGQCSNLPAHFKLVSLPGSGHMLPTEARRPATAAIRATVRRATRGA